MGFTFYVFFLGAISEKRKLFGMFKSKEFTNKEI